MPDSIHSKLLAIQSALKAPKDQKNSFGNYKYRSCEGILEALKPLLNKQGLILTISDKMVAVGERVYVKATATIQTQDAVTKSAENLSPSTYVLFVSAYAREALAKKGMDEAQITGAASSYARKYALNGLFLIDDTADVDSMDNTEKVEKVAPKTVTTPPAGAPSELILKIQELCKETTTDPVKLQEHYKVSNHCWDLSSANQAIASLKKKLGGQVEDAA